MSFNGIKIALAAGMVASPAVSCLTAVNNVALAKEQDGTSTNTLKKNTFLSLVESTTGSSDIIYQDGVIVESQKVTVSLGESEMTVSKTDKLSKAKDGDVVVLTNTTQGVQTLKVLSIQDENNETFKISYTAPELKEVIKSLKTDASQNSDIINQIKALPNSVEKLMEAYKKAGISSRFISLLQEGFNSTYSDLFSEIDKVDITDKNAVNTYIEQVNSKILDEGYATNAYNIVKIVESMTDETALNNLSNINADDMKSLNKVLDLFMDVYDSDGVTQEDKEKAYNEFLSSFKDVINNMDKSENNSNQNQTSSDGSSNDSNQNQTDNSNSAKTDSDSKETKTGDFSGTFTLTEIPAECSEQYLKIHDVTDEKDASKSHSYNYYRVVAKDSDGNEIAMMALANDDNVEILKNYKDGEKVTVEYTVSECSQADGGYDYVINKMTKADSDEAKTDETTTGTNADTGLQNNNIYYIVGIGVAAIGIGAIVYNKKKKEI